MELVFEDAMEMLLQQDLLRFQRILTTAGSVQAQDCKMCARTAFVSLEGYRNAWKVLQDLKGCKIYAGTQLTGHEYGAPGKSVHQDGNDDDDDVLMGCLHSRCAQYIVIISVADFIQHTWSIVPRASHFMLWPFYVFLERSLFCALTTMQELCAACVAQGMHREMQTHTLSMTWIDHKHEHKNQMQSSIPQHFPMQTASLAISMCLATFKGMSHQMELLICALSMSGYIKAGFPVPICPALVCAPARIFRADLGSTMPCLKQICFHSRTLPCNNPCLHATCALFATRAQVNGILHGNIGQEALEGAFQDDMISNTLVFLMRLITSAEVQRREDHFLPFILVGYILNEALPASVTLSCHSALCSRDTHGLGVVGVQPRLIGKDSDSFLCVIMIASRPPVTVALIERSA
eukprot:1157998-Pelagomonas_calceolata.AAC.4